MAEEGREQAGAGGNVTVANLEEEISRLGGMCGSIPAERVVGVLGLCQHADVISYHRVGLSCPQPRFVPP